MIIGTLTQRELRHKIRNHLVKKQFAMPMTYPTEASWIYSRWLCIVYKDLEAEGVYYINKYTVCGNRAYRYCLTYNKVDVDALFKKYLSLAQICRNIEDETKNNIDACMIKACSTECSLAERKWIIECANTIKFMLKDTRVE